MGCHDNIYKLFDLNDDLCISFLAVCVQRSAKTKNRENATAQWHRISQQHANNQVVNDY